MKPWGLVPICLAIASLVHAQSPAAAPSAWQLGAAVVASIHTEGLASAPCDHPDGQLGDFCGSAAGTGPGVVLAVGRSVGARAAVEFEATLEPGRTGSATYYRYAGHFATDRTDATYTHREQLLSLLVRLHPGSSNAPARIQPVIGATLAHGTDALTAQTRTIVDSSVNYRNTTQPPDVSTDRWALGVTGGADVLLAHHRRVALVGTGRLRVVGWRSVDSADVPGIVSVGAGRLSVQLGAGVRWGGSGR